MDKSSILEIFPRSFFGALPLPCLRGLKSLMSMTTAALHRLPAMSKLLLVGVVLIGFFGQSSSPISHQFHLAVLPRPPLCQKTASAGFLHAPGATTNKMSSGEEVATHWLPPSLAR